VETHHRKEQHQMRVDLDALQNMINAVGGVNHDIQEVRFHLGNALGNFDPTFSSRNSQLISQDVDDLTIKLIQAEEASYILYNRLVVLRQMLERADHLHFEIPGGK
jgi:hypothetical protein